MKNAHYFTLAVKSTVKLYIIWFKSLNLVVMGRTVTVFWYRLGAGFMRCLYIFPLVQGDSSKFCAVFCRKWQTLKLGEECICRNSVAVASVCSTGDVCEQTHHTTLRLMGIYSASAVID